MRLRVARPSTKFSCISKVAWHGLGARLTVQQDLGAGERPKRRSRLKVKDVRCTSHQGALS
jgi:hypothetical protein